MKNKGYKVLEDLAKKETDEQRKKRKNGLTIENLAEKGIKKKKPNREKLDEYSEANTLHMVKNDPMKLKNEP